MKKGMSLVVVLIGSFLFSSIVTHLPEFLAGDLAAASIKKPFNIKEIAIDESLLKTYAGVYEEDGVERLITVENAKLYYQIVGEQIEYETLRKRPILF